MILYLESLKVSTKTIRINEFKKVTDKKSTYKNQLHIYTLTINNKKRKLRR